MKPTAYKRLYNILREKILQQEYAPGQKLPTERELVRQYGVSRITIRHAMRLLQNQGLVERRQGWGTYVKSGRPPKISIFTSDYVGSIYTEAPGLIRELLTCKKQTPPPAILEIFGLLKNETCLVAKRLDVLNGKAIAYDCAYIPSRWTGSIDDAMLVRIDFLDVWAIREGIPIQHVKESIEAIAATEEAAEILGIQPMSSLLQTTGIVYTSTGEAVAVFESFYRGDQVKLISTFSKTTLTTCAK